MKYLDVCSIHGCQIEDVCTVCEEEGRRYALIEGERQNETHMGIEPKDFEECQKLQCSHCAFCDEIPEDTRKLIQYYTHCSHRIQFEEMV